MKIEFIKCGLIGWCMEVLWTGLHSYHSKDKNLTCNTSVWMFPIYGMAAFLKPINKLICKLNIVYRGIIYASCIFSVEYLTGTFLKKRNMCPWDYSKSKLNYKGVIRYDYAPVWFAVGLFYEWILCPCNKEKSKKS